MSDVGRTLRFGRSHQVARPVRPAPPEREDRR